MRKVEQIDVILTLIERVAKLGFGIISTAILIAGAVWYVYQLKPVLENNTAALTMLTKVLEQYVGKADKMNEIVVVHDARSVEISGDLDKLKGQVGHLQNDVAQIKGILSVQN